MSNQRERKTVLIVEDVAEISLQMGAMLRRKGHRVLQAVNAEDAIRIAEDKRPNMILTDIDLPTFDSLLSLVRGHREMANMLVAIVDLNHPDLREHDDVKVLSNFDQLDDLLGS